MGPELIFLGLTGMLVLFSVLRFARIPECPPAEKTREHQRLSIVIPARNEAANLPALLQSLGIGDNTPAEILVVDDGSTDDTAAVARGRGATVLSSAPLPRGWRGKTWACHQGAAAAAGELLLFLDADTRLLPGGLTRMLAARPAAGALSLLPYHEVRRTHEQGSAWFNLMMALGIGLLMPAGWRARPTDLAGPSLLIDRDTYRRCGGHAAVRRHILEHLNMAALIRQAGGRTRCRGGRGVLAMRMYPGGWREMIQGWSKAFTQGAASTPPALMAAAILWITAGLLTAGGLAAALWRPAALPLAATWLLLYLLYALHLQTRLRRLGSFSALLGALYPLPLLFYLGVFSLAGLRLRWTHTTRWKGRMIPAEGEDP